MGRLVVLLCLLVASTSDDALWASGQFSEHNEHERDQLTEKPGEDTVTSMGEPHAHLGPHFRWTASRAPTEAERRRAQDLVETLRQALQPYQDYRRAIADGYEPFLPNVAQPHYHFTSKWRGFKSAFRFEPAQPTSLLYKKTSAGYELEGAMYTAPTRTSEKDLDKRVPLSIGRWHAHVNICLPPKRADETADWTRYGPKGSIVTEAECSSLKGRWVTQLFGWMIHVYPFKDSPEQIWTH